MTHFEFQKLDAYVVAREVAVLVQRARIRDVELCDQATRAAKSCFLNVAEGLPSFQPGMRRKFFACAHGSLGEVAAALDLAMALGAVDAQPELEAAIARLAPIVCGLLRRG